MNEPIRASTAQSPVPIAGQAARFLVVGAAATALQYAVLFALVQAAGWNAAVASTLGFAASLWLNYALNRRYTFASDRPHAQALPRFLVIASGGLLLTAVGMQIAVEHVGLNYLVSQLIVTGVVTIWNFVLNRCWSFRQAR